MEGTASSPVPALAAENVVAWRGDRRVLHEISVSFPAGSITALCGPNGCGKTTLLRVLAGLDRPASGRAWIDGQAVDGLPRRALARRVAVLPQALPVPDGLTVGELVRFGRHPHGRLFLRDAEGPQAVDWALSATRLEALASRPVAALSGGERQRAWIAMVLAQRASTLLLDEPTTYLDLAHQIEILGLVRRLSREAGLAVVWVLHELNQAAAFSDIMVLMRDGRIRRRGSPSEVMTEEALAEVFDLRARVMPHPDTGAPVCLPHVGSAT